MNCIQLYTDINISYQTKPFLQIYRQHNKVSCDYYDENIFSENTEARDKALRSKLMIVNVMLSFLSFI